MFNKRGSKMTEPILKTKNLKKYFKTKKGLLHAVDGVDLSVNAGETLGVVGESGCGKTTLGKLILRLLEPTEGEILFKGENIINYNRRKMKSLRKEMQFIFQDPYSSLDPRMSIGTIIAEPLIVNGSLDDKNNINTKVEELMNIVGLSNRLINAYPHELDGGRRQRVGIARAIALNPKFIVCDEPVSALDVSIQAQILNLLMDLQEEKGLSYIFITHDLSVVKHISNRISVMYLGQCVEQAYTDELFSNPKHPYTIALLKALPKLNIRTRGKIEIIEGEPTNPVNPKTGCRFAQRCKYVTAKCTERNIKLKEIEKDHFVACFLFDK